MPKRIKFLLTLLAFVVVVPLFVTKVIPHLTRSPLSPRQEQSILGEEKGSEESEEDEDGDEEEDEADEEEGDEEEDEEDDEDEDEDEKDKEEDREEKEEKEEEEEEREEITTREQVENPDGTVSEIVREREGGEEEIRITTYDEEGTVIEERRIERGEGEKEVEVKKYGVSGNELRELSLEWEEGKLELEVEEGEEDVSKVEYDVDGQKLRVESSEAVEGEGEEVAEREREVEISATREGRFQLSQLGQQAFVEMPLSVEDDTGKIFVKTADVKRPINALPGDVAGKVLGGKDGLERVEGMEIVTRKKAGAAESAPLYAAYGAKTESLLGLVPLEIRKTLFYDAQTGSFAGAETNLFNSVLDFLSF